MASITRTANGNWRARACLGRDERTGKQIWRTATFQPPSELTPAKAEREVKRQIDAWERQQRADFEAGLDAHRDRVTLEAFTRGSWWKCIEARGLSFNTISTYKRMKETVLEYYGPRIRLMEINAERVNGFTRWLRTEKNFSAVTVRMAFDVLRSILNYATECGYLDLSPVDKMRRRDKPQVKHTEPDFLNPDEARTFLETLDRDSMPQIWKTYFSLLLFAGVRRSEGLALQWQDYDPDRQELLISKSVTLTGETGAVVAIKSTKTGRSRRVPVTDTLAAALEARRQEMISQYGSCEKTWYIFGNTDDPATPQNPNRVYARLMRFQDRNGLRRTSVHLLRHSFASLALANGANVKSIQTVLGHSRPSMTLQFYSGVSEKANRAAVEALERAVKPTETPQDMPQEQDNPDMQEP